MVKRKFDPRCHLMLFLRVTYLAEFRSYQWELAYGDAQRLRTRITTNTQVELKHYFSLIGYDIRIHSIRYTSSYVITNSISPYMTTTTSLSYLNTTPSPSYVTTTPSYVTNTSSNVTFNYTSSLCNYNILLFRCDYQLHLLLCDYHNLLLLFDYHLLLCDSPM